MWTLLTWIVAASEPVVPAVGPCAAVLDIVAKGQAITDRQVLAAPSVCWPVARNAAFARHGRAFADEALRVAFAAQPWYREDAGYDDKRLTAVDKANVARIKRLEDERRRHDDARVMRAVQTGELIALEGPLPTDGGGVLIQFLGANADANPNASRQVTVLCADGSRTPARLSGSDNTGPWLAANVDVTVRNGPCFAIADVVDARPGHLEIGINTPERVCKDAPAGIDQASADRAGVDASALRCLAYVGDWDGDGKSEIIRHVSGTLNESEWSLWSAAGKQLRVISEAGGAF